MQMHACSHCGKASDLGCMHGGASAANGGAIDMNVFETFPFFKDILRALPGQIPQTSNQQPLVQCSFPEASRIFRSFPDSANEIEIAHRSDSGSSNTARISQGAIMAARMQQAAGAGAVGGGALGQNHRSASWTAGGPSNVKLNAAHARIPGHTRSSLSFSAARVRCAFSSRLTSM